jgi:S1-C subfamily serine protease
VVIVGCGTTAPIIKYSTPSHVTIEHTNMGLRPVLTRAVRDLAERYCKEQGKYADYTGILRDSGWGPEEFDFRCVNYTEPQQVQAKKEPTPQPPEEPTPQSGSGSGFFVSKMGHVITNAHVVKNCNKVTIGDNANKQVPAELINTDRSNDLALLKLSTLEMASAESQSLIQKLGIVIVPLAANGLLRNEDVRLGEKVLVAGYPFGDVFSNTIKVTSGIVSATRGAGDDSGQFQLDAAVQPGNSGGPIYDSGGNIVGVVISQLDKLKMAKAIGSLPENVNFGIKASTVRQFLISSGLPSKKSERTEEKSTEQLAEIAKNQALMVMCLQ